MAVETCPECKAKDKKYQIIQADLDFQLKKMREDLAQEKVLLQQQYQKQIKKASQKYNKQKRERDEQNKKWIDKYDKKVQQYDQLIDSLTRKYQQTIHDTKEQLTNTFHRKQCKLLEQHQLQLLALKKEQEHALRTAQQNQNRQVASVKKHEEITIGQLENNHRETMEQITNEHQSRMEKLRTQMEEINLTKNSIQKEASDKQRTLYQQIYQRKQEIVSLKYQISHLDDTLKNLQEQIRLKGIQIQVLKQKFQQDLKSANQKFTQQKQQLIAGFNLQIQKLLVNKLEDCNKFEQSVKDIEIKRQNQVKIYEHCLKEVKEKVSERPSREEDLEQINFLKSMLVEKEKQFQNLISVAKGYKLQLEYKEETFNRIFPSNQNTNNPQPLNIEKMLGSRKESKSSKGLPTQLQTTTKFNSIKSSASQQEAKKEKERNMSKTTKIF